MGSCFHFDNGKIYCNGVTAYDTYPNGTVYYFTPTFQLWPNNTFRDASWSPDTLLPTALIHLGRNVYIFLVIFNFALLLAVSLLLPAFFALSSLHSTPNRRTIRIVLIATGLVCAPMAFTLHGMQAVFATFPLMQASVIDVLSVPRFWNVASSVSYLGMAADFMLGIICLMQLICDMRECWADRWSRKESEPAVADEEKDEGAV
ncbi:hypothetical protein LTR08_006011 [Meristemomyces frigidus]|nr:hypothetical protein LTR08_006011 [Meristemomyces frigidus]